ncbi:MAG: MBL fold metallo-hydrolase [Pseudomonadota bacterium]
MRLAALAATAFLATTATAQNDFADVTIESTPISDNVYFLSGAGGNMGLVIGDRHAFLIDDQYAPLAERIVEKIAEITDRPLTFVINTHWHGDHSGGNAGLTAAGVIVVAHENVYRRMGAKQVIEFFQRETPPSPSAALPVVTFTRDIALQLGGETVQAMHVPNAHTDGDSVVFLPEQNILHTGDIFFNTLYPFIDVDSGGGIIGMIAAVTMLLELVDDDTTIIPGHGPIASREDLLRYRDFLATVAERVSSAIDAGKSLADIVAAKPTAEFDATLNANGFLPPDRWVTMIHRDLSRPVH